MERELQGQGRILLRASGTEPLVRVMVEGVDPATVQAMADRLADALREVLAA
jgi:phosphoglucosamine mutase